MIKMREIRPDVAKHIVLGQFITIPVMLFSILAFGLVGGYTAGFSLMAAFALYELYQWKFKKGTGSLTDWIAGSYLAGFMMALMSILVSVL